MPAHLSLVFLKNQMCALAACQYLTTAINSGITQPAFASQTLHDLTTYAADTLVSDFIDNCRSVDLDPTAISGDALHDVLEGEILRGINKHVADIGYPSRTQFNNSTARMESPLLRGLIRAREQGQSTPVFVKVDVRVGASTNWRMVMLTNHQIGQRNDDTHTLATTLVVGDDCK